MSALYIITGIHIPWRRLLYENTLDSKVYGANIGPTWDLSAPDGPHVVPMNLAIRDAPDVPGLYRKSSDTANNTATWSLKDEATDMSVGRWAAGQPDITKGTCVAVDLSVDSHLWSFIPCYEKLPFVCQIPALPPGTAIYTLYSPNKHWVRIMDVLMVL